MWFWKCYEIKDKLSGVLLHLVSCLHSTSWYHGLQPCVGLCPLDHVACVDLVPCRSIMSGFVPRSGRVFLSPYAVRSARGFPPIPCCFFSVYRSPLPLPFYCWYSIWSAPQTMPQEPFRIRRLDMLGQSCCKSSLVTVYLFSFVFYLFLYFFIIRTNNGIINMDLIRDKLFIQEQINALQTLLLSLPLNGRFFFVSFIFFWLPPLTTYFYLSFLG